MTWTTLFFCNLLFGILCVILAKKKQKPALFWFLLSVPLGVIALFALLALPDETTPEEVQEGPEQTGK
jgi:hypothetical protein